MSETGKKIRELRLSHKPKIKQKDLAEAIGISTVYMSDVERDIKDPSYEVIVKAAKCLGVPLSALLPKDVVESPLPIHRVPLISWVRAGAVHEPADIYQPGFAEEWVASNTTEPNAFALTVTGESMIPEFYDGDIIVVNPTLEPGSGDFAVVKINGEVTFKQVFFYMNKVVLRPVNKAYKTIELERHDGYDIQIVGKVVEQIRRR